MITRCGYCGKTHEVGNDENFKICREVPLDTIVAIDPKATILPPALPHDPSPDDFLKQVCELPDHFIVEVGNKGRMTVKEFREWLDTEPETIAGVVVYEPCYGILEENTIQ